MVVVVLDVSLFVKNRLPVSLDDIEGKVDVTLLSRCCTDGEPQIVQVIDLTRYHVDQALVRDALEQLFI